MMMIKVLYVVYFWPEPTSYQIIWLIYIWGRPFVLFGEFMPFLLSFCIHMHVSCTCALSHYNNGLLQLYGCLRDSFYIQNDIWCNFIVHYRLQPSALRLGDGCWNMCYLNKDAVISWISLLTYLGGNVQKHFKDFIRFNWFYFVSKTNVVGRTCRNLCVLQENSKVINDKNM